MTATPTATPTITPTPEFRLLSLALKHLASADGLFVFGVKERSQRQDLNGDGDRSDEIVHVFDTAAHVLTNLRLSSARMLAAGRYAAFEATERRSGQTDLNGDGDRRERVLQIWDGVNDRLVNTSQAVRWMAMSERYVVFVTPERQQRVDLNADGDLRDQVLQVWDLEDESLINTGLDARAFAFAGDHILVSVREASQGRTDLNGDGDTLDLAAFVYTISTGVSANLGFEIYRPELSAKISDTACIFTVNEGMDGKGDVNGNGAVNNAVAKIYVFATQTLIPVNLAVGSNSSVTIGDRLAAVTVSERFNSLTDLNGDGDDGDDVVHAVDLATGEIRNLETHGRWPVSVGDHIIFVAGEQRQGDSDLNSDGDTTDAVARSYHFPTATFTDLGAVRPEPRQVRELSGNRFKRAFRVDGERVLFVGRERSNRQDANGDADARDQILYIYDTSAPELIDTGFDAVGYDVRGDLVAIATRERAQNRVDQNLDADKRDFVLNVLDLRTRAVLPFKLAVGRLVLSAGDTFVAFGASERRQFQTSYNGDPDTRDLVVGWTGSLWP